jgi:hypothetical protein
MLKHSFNDRALMFDIVGLSNGWRERDANKDTKKSYEKLRFMLFFPQWNELMISAGCVELHSHTQARS